MKNRPAKVNAPRFPKVYASVKLSASGSALVTITTSEQMTEAKMIFTSRSASQISRPRPTSNPNIPSMKGLSPKGRGLITMQKRREGREDEGQKPDLSAASDHQIDDRPDQGRGQRCHCCCKAAPHCAAPRANPAPENERSDQQQHRAAKAKDQFSCHRAGCLAAPLRTKKRSAAQYGDAAEEAEIIPAPAIGHRVNCDVRIEERSDERPREDKPVPQSSPETG